MLKGSLTGKGQQSASVFDTSMPCRGSSVGEGALLTSSSDTQWNSTEALSSSQVCHKSFTEGWQTMNASIDFGLLERVQSYISSRLFQLPRPIEHHITNISFFIPIQVSCTHVPSASSPSASFWQEWPMPSCPLMHARIRPK